MQVKCIYSWLGVRARDFRNGLLMYIPAAGRLPSPWSCPMYSSSLALPRSTCRSSPSLPRHLAHYPCHHRIFTSIPIFLTSATSLRHPHIVVVTSSASSPRHHHLGSLPTTITMINLIIIIITIIAVVALAPSCKLVRAFPGPFHAGHGVGGPRVRLPEVRMRGSHQLDA